MLQCHTCSLPPVSATAQHQLLSCVKSNCGVVQADIAATKGLHKQGIEMHCAHALMVPLPGTGYCKDAPQLQWWHLSH